MKNFQKERLKEFYEEIMFKKTENNSSFLHKMINFLRYMNFTQSLFIMNEEHSNEMF